MNEQKIKELFSDEQFVKELFALETPEEVQAVLVDNDIEISVEDILKIKELLTKKESGELSDEELEQVAGGSLFAALFFTVCGIATAVSCGGVGAAVHVASRGRW